MIVGETDEFLRGKDNFLNLINHQLILEYVLLISQWKESENGLAWCSCHLISTSHNLKFHEIYVYLIIIKHY